MKTSESIKNKGTKRIIRRKKNLSEGFETSPDIKDIKDIKKTGNGDKELNLTEQQIANMFARGIRQHQICEQTNYSAGRVSQILQKSEVKKEIRNIQSNFFGQIDSTIQEAYTAGWDAWKEKARAGELSPAELLEGFTHIETLRGARQVVTAEGGGIAPLTLETTTQTQKRISLADNLNNLPQEGRLGILKAIKDLLGENSQPLLEGEERAFKEGAIEIEKG